MGKGYIIGAGPGDIGLITQKGYKLIEKADVVLYDRLVDKRILEITPKKCELIYVGKESTEGGESQEKINKIFVRKIKENKNVIRLHGGDPFLFGRGTEEIDELIKENLEFEVVPGISSSLAVPAYNGIPVTKRDISSSLHIFTARGNGGNLALDFHVLAQIQGTIVILMGLSVLDKIIEGLIKEGVSKDRPISVIQEGTTYKQKSVEGTLENIEKLVKEKDIKAPSIIVIGEIAKLHGKYDWFTKRKLFGERILLTRDSKSFNKSSVIFEKEGAEVIDFSLIKLDTNYEKFDSLFFEEIEKADIVSFNSPTCVESFYEGISALKKDFRILGNKNVVCIGSGTVEALKKYYIIPDFVPKEYSVKSLLKELKGKYGKNKNVLLLSSNIHNRNENELSKEYELNVKIKDIYTNSFKKYEKKEIEEKLKEQGYLIFLSSSAVESFYENIKDKNLNLEKIKIVSIGPMTSETLKKYSFKISIEAKEYSLEGILEEIIKKH